MAYLDDHPNPNLAQQRARRDRPSGLIVVHTAESALDVIGDDAGAEGVARFISTRSDYGSYHRVADSDSVVDVARFEMTVYGDATGSNDFAIHLSFACHASDWPGMSAERRDAFLRNGAAAAREAAAWLERVHGITVPAERVTRAESDQRRPGFISHAERDPARRTDPGPAFPWDRFLTLYSNEENDMTPQQATQLTEALAAAKAAETAATAAADNSAKAVRLADRARRRTNAQVKRLMGRLDYLKTHSDDLVRDVDEIKADLQTILDESEDDEL